MAHVVPKINIEANLAAVNNLAVHVLVRLTS